MRCHGDGNVLAYLLVLEGPQLRAFPSLGLDHSLLLHNLPCNRGKETFTLCLS